MDLTDPAARRAAFGATALAAVAARFGGVEHGHWIALTVLVVLRPETAHTYTRCAGRIATLAAGVTVASGLTLMWQPEALPAAACALALVALAYWLSRFGYLAVGVPLGAALMFFLGVGGAPNGRVSPTVSSRS